MSLALGVLLLSIGTASALLPLNPGPPYGAWRVEALCQGVAILPDIALDSQGRPHVIRGCLLSPAYGVREGGVWRTESLPLLGGLRSTIVIDSRDQPHVVGMFTRESTPYTQNYFPAYAYRTPEGWHIEEVTPVPDPSSWASTMVLDSQERPHLLLAEGILGASIYYVTKNSTGWHSELVAEQSLNDLALGLDENDVPHVAYAAYSPPGRTSLMYATRTPNGTWEHTLLDTAGAWEINLEIDTHGAIHIQHEGQYEQILYAVKKPGEPWQHTTVVSGMNAMDTDLAVDGEGRPHIVFRTRDPFGDRLRGHLHYATIEQDGSWWIEKVDHTLDATFPKIAVTSDGMPSIITEIRGSEVDHRLNGEHGAYYVEPIVRTPRLINEL